MEKPREFAPRGQATMTLASKKKIDPLRQNKNDP